MVEQTKTGEVKTADLSRTAGDGVHHWRLYFPAGADGAGFLSTRLDVGEDLNVMLSPRIARVLSVLRQARLDDADIPSPAARGWRSKPVIARSIAARHLREDHIEEALVYPVTTGTTDHPGGYQGAMEEFYAESATRLAAHLAEAPE